MAQPPAPPGGGGPRGPPAPPYPPYPYYPMYVPPPRTDRTVLIVVVVVVVLVVVVPIALAAILYVMVSGLIGGPSAPARPVVAFTAATLTTGNATFRVSGTSLTLPLPEYLYVLAVNSTAGPTQGFAPSGTAASYVLSGRTYRVTLTDANADGLLGGGDSVRVAGDGVPLQRGSTFTFNLIHGPSGELDALSWST